MNDEDLRGILDLLAQSDTGNATAHTLDDGSGTPQIWWDDGKYLTSITVFPPGPDTEAIKAMTRTWNEVVWCGNIRFTRTRI
jgi:hypothetical protein